MVGRPAGSYPLSILVGVVLSLGLAACWWYSSDPKTIGWLMIISIFAVPAAIFAYALAFCIAAKAGRLVPVFWQILMAGFLPGLLVFLYYVPHLFHDLELDRGGRSQAWMFWHVFGPVIQARLVTIPGGLAGGALLFLTGDSSDRRRGAR